MKFHTKAVTLALLFLASTVSAVVPDDDVGGERCEDQDWDTYVVGFKDRASHDAFLATGVQTAGLGVAELNAVVLQFDSEEEAKAWGAGKHDVEYVEKDGPVCATQTSSSAEQTPYGITMVKALEIPDYVANSGIKMCILDTGYQRHEDLPNDQNGDPVTGKSGLCGSPCLWDAALDAHGNHVAGTIAAIGGNSKGVIGVVKNNKMPLHIVRVFQTNSGSWTAVANGLLNCDQEGANIASMSLGGGGTSAPTVIQNAVDTILATNNKFLMIAAAGNAGNGSYSWPASMPEMMSVASVTSTKARSYFSQYNDQVDIAAPGSNVLSTVLNNGYASYSGTSMATPHVAGVAGKIWSHAPSMTAQEVRDILEATAEDLGTTGRDDYYGHGLVNAKAAFQMLGPAPPSVSPAPTSMPSPIPTLRPTSVPTSTPTAAPTSSVSPTVSMQPSSSPSSSPSEWCPDSPVWFLLNGQKKSCNMARRKPKLCRNKKVKKTCPNACDACRFKCADSPLPFYLKASATNTKSCWRIAKQSPEKIKNLCARPKIRNTCRKTCEVCGVDATVINFDEAEINDTAEYYRTDLQLENWWSTTGRTEYYNTGYMYGTKSEPNVGFNGWGRPITMTCPGGSFSFISSWMTPAWADGLSVTIIGSSGGVEKGRYSTNLSTTTNPVLIEGLNPAYFTDIDELVIESSPSQVVMDDMMIKIISPCTVTRVEADPNADGAGAMADPLMV